MSTMAGLVAEELERTAELFLLDTAESVQAIPANVLVERVHVIAARLKYLAGKLREAV